MDYQAAKKRANPARPNQHDIDVKKADAVFKIVLALRIRIIHAASGELLRQLTFDPTKDWQPTGAPNGKAPNLMQVQSYSDVLSHHSAASAVCPREGQTVT
jgi:hypothetical protein